MPHYATPSSPGDWVDRAACARPGAPPMVVYPNSSLQAIDARRRMCQRCPVLAECRSWALTAPDPATGHMAGAMTPDERAQARKRGES